MPPPWPPPPPPIFNWVFDQNVMSSSWNYDQIIPYTSYFCCCLFSVWKIPRNEKCKIFLNYLVNYLILAMIAVSTSFRQFVFSNVDSMLHSSLYASITLRLIKLNLITFINIHAHFSHIRTQYPTKDKCMLYRKLLDKHWPCNNYCI